MPWSEDPDQWPTTETLYVRPFEFFSLLNGVAILGRFRGEDRADVMTLHALRIATRTSAATRSPDRTAPSM